LRSVTSDCSRFTHDKYGRAEACVLMATCVASSYTFLFSAISALTDRDGVNEMGQIHTNSDRRTTTTKAF
jgi:hypothetical protein